MPHSALRLFPPSDWFLSLPQKPLGAWSSWLSSETESSNTRSYLDLLHGCFDGERIIDLKFEKLLKDFRLSLIGGIRNTTNQTKNEKRINSRTRAATRKKRKGKKARGLTA